MDSAPPLGALMGGTELIVVFSALLVLLFTRKIPDFSDGLRRGMKAFREAADETAIDVGKSAGGINGKPAAEALTIDNETVELYEPAILGERPRRDTREFRRATPWIVALSMGIVIPFLVWAIFGQ